MSTRILTGNITDISEHARPGFALQVVVTPTAITPTGIIPESVEPIETDADGNFAIEVATGVQLEVKLSDAFRRIGTTTNVGNGNIIKRGMVVPHGMSPITVQAVLTLNTEPDAPGDLITLANEHIGNQSNPHNVTPAQLHLENVANVSPADLPISDATQIAIDAVDDAVTAHTSDHDNPHGVTAHQVDAYTQAETDSMVSGVTSALAVVSGRTDTLEDRVDAIDTDLGDLDTEQSSTALALSNHVADMGNPHGTTKAQVGLANADNTADVDKPVSTATQNALNLKANTADLGTAAFANTGAFATAAQGTKADSAVQPAALDGLNADRHTHANKPILDGIGALNLAPNGGLRGQALTVGSSGREWADVPGIAYPSLLLSPDGSRDRNGVIVPTVGGSVSIVGGQYGNAWSSSISTGSGTVSVPNTYIDGSSPFTILMRFKLSDNNGDNQWVLSMGSTAGVLIGRYSGSSSYNVYLSSSISTVSAFVSGTFVTIAVIYAPVSTIWTNGALTNALVRPAPSLGSTIASYGGGDFAVRESILIYPIAVPGTEIARISTMPRSWTMANAAVNTYQPQSQFGLFNPTHKTASGTTQFTSAPGVGTTAIASLSAGTEIEVSAGVRTVSSVSYTLVKLKTGEVGYIPTSQITTL
jgi:hypothetical protein